MLIAPAGGLLQSRLFRPKTIICGRSRVSQVRPAPFSRKALVSVRAGISKISTTMPFNILVIGAGELGTAVLKSLAAHDRRQSSSITTLVRSSSITQPSAAKKAEFTRLQVLGIKLLGGDIEAANEGELQHVFEKYDTVISCSGMAGSSGLQVKLARAAIAAKVSRYVPWQYGLDCML